MCMGSPPGDNRGSSPNYENTIRLCKSVSRCSAFFPEKIRRFIDLNSPVNIFCVGTYIAKSSLNPFTSDIHEIDGRPVAKRGRLPGVTLNDRLDRVM